jgi:hypothetical protein
MGRPFWIFVRPVAISCHQLLSVAINGERAVPALCHYAILLLRVCGGYRLDGFMQGAENFLSIGMILEE